MNPEELEDKSKQPEGASPEGKPEGDQPEGEQDPLKTELENVQKKTGKTKVEKLLFKKKEIDRQLREEGVETENEEEPEEDDDKPVTRKELKEFQAKQATKTALELADGITNETERELVKHYLQNNIKASGDPQEDFRLAQGLANAAKNKQILEETNRKGNPQTSPSGSGAPAPQNMKDGFVPTRDEQMLMSAPYNVTKEQVLAARASQGKK